MKIMKYMKKGILFNVSGKLQLMLFLAESAEDAREYLCAPSALCERIIDLYGPKKFRMPSTGANPIPDYLNPFWIFMCFIDYFEKARARKRHRMKTRNKFLRSRFSDGKEKSSRSRRANLEERWVQCREVKRNAEIGLFAKPSKNL